MKYSKLQNGSDIRGIAMENDKGEEVNLTREAVVSLSRAFAVWLKEKSGKDSLKISIGRDSRLTGETIIAWTAAGLAAEGVKATDFGMASTPAMFMSTVLGDCPYDGAVMITASHLPSHRNGMKFFTPQGGLEKGDIAKLIELAENMDPAADGKPAAYENFIDTYAAHLCDIIRKNVKQLKTPLKMSSFRVLY